jgi:hypothetical protein
LQNGNLSITNLISAIPWIGQVFLIFYTLYEWDKNIDSEVDFQAQAMLLTKKTYIYNKSKLSNSISFAHEVRNYSTSTRGKLDPDFVSGFIDAEASFTTVVYYKNRWCVNSVFKISLHVKDIELLNSIQAFFGVGRITVGNSANYRVERISDLVNYIIPHLEKYPLIGKKKADYELFKRIVLIMKDKLHLTEEGLQEIINLKASMNNGVTEELLAEFPSTTPVERPLVKESAVTDIRPNWLAGFTSGDGCFYVYVEKNSKLHTGYRVKLRFNICQHLRDKSLLECINSYLNCGNVLETSRGEINFDVHKFSENYEIISPFFSRYPILGVKALDFQDWKSVAEIIKSKGHLTKEGIEEIIKIKSNMNKSRTCSGLNM